MCKIQWLIINGRSINNANTWCPFTFGHILCLSIYLYIYLYYTDKHATCSHEYDRPAVCWSCMRCPHWARQTLKGARIHNQTCTSLSGWVQGSINFAIREVINRWRRWWRRFVFCCCCCCWALLINRDEYAVSAGTTSLISTHLVCRTHNCRGGGKLCWQQDDVLNSHLKSIFHLQCDSINQLLDVY